MILLDQPSFQSVYVEPRVNDLGLSHATAFVVFRPNGAPLLVTNWHVVSGRHHETREPLAKSGGLPNCLRIQHNIQDRLGVWTSVIEPLYNAAGAPLWLEHPVHGSRVDVVGLPLTNIQGMALYPHSQHGVAGSGAAELPLPMKWGPSDFVNVIGFPFGFSGGGGMGIWVQGAIATEPDLDYRDLPRFLIDSRTRSGQSGSPVVIYKRNGWVTLKDGRPYMLHNPVTLLIGVYSGRLTAESDLGTVWKTSIVAAIAENGVPGAPE